MSSVPRAPEQCPRPQEHWRGLPRPPPGDPPNPGIEPVSLTSPALADGFFTPCQLGNPFPDMGSSTIKRMMITTLSPSAFPGGSGSKASAYNAGDSGSILGLGRSPGEGNGNPLQYSCLEISMSLVGSMGSQRVGHDRATSLHISPKGWMEHRTPDTKCSITVVVAITSLNILGSQHSKLAWLG